MKTKSPKRLILLSLFIAIGAILGLVESSLPIPIPLPGARLGFANIAVLSTLNLIGPVAALIVAVGKSLLLLLLSGNVTSFFYSLAGGIASAIGMALAKKYFDRYLSEIGISEIGSFFHNIAQVTVAAWVIQNSHLIIYLPLLLGLGLLTGYFVGWASLFFLRHFSKILRI